MFCFHFWLMLLNGKQQCIWLNARNMTYLHAVTQLYMKGTDRQNFIYFITRVLHLLWLPSQLTAMFSTLWSDCRLPTNLVWVINGKLKLQCTCNKQFTLDNTVTQTPICRANIQWWLITVQNPVEQSNRNENFTSYTRTLFSITHKHSFCLCTWYV